MRELTLELANKFLELHRPIKVKTKRKIPMKIKTFTNEYEVTMLEIKTKPRPTFISAKKAQAIIATNDDSSRITPITKHGRDLFSIKHLECERSFTIGDKKINTVLDNADSILETLGV